MSYAYLIYYENDDTQLKVRHKQENRGECLYDKSWNGACFDLLRK